jgi:DnaD/phage-associated family protein
MFKGFGNQETFTPIPDTFLTRLLSEIDDLEELKVSLHALWCVGNMESPVRLLRQEDFTSILSDPEAALEKAVQRGTLLRVEQAQEACYFLNSPRGRLAAEALANGEMEAAALAGVHAPRPRPNIFRLYEENIGPLTPLLADALKDAEQTYDPEWVCEALEIAVKRNKRNWHYIEAILRRWKEDGHAKKQTGRDTEETGRRYVEGEYGEFIEH